MLYHSQRLVWIDTIVFLSGYFGNNYERLLYMLSDVYGVEFYAA